MGIYLNPGSDAFQMALNDDIYVDKTGLIDFVNSKIGKRKRFICVSRPRRFGKSDQLLEATLNMDAKKVASVIERVHSAATAPVFYNNEQALRSVI